MRQGLLDTALDRAGAAALLVVAESSRDPDLAVFVGSAHLGESFLLAVPGRAPLLGFLADMERDEAAATGLELAGAAETVLECRSRGATESETWIAVLAAALERVGLAKGTVALAGRAPAGRTHVVTAALEERGFVFTDGHLLMRGLRKSKSRDEIDAVRRAAEGTCCAFRRVAEVLASAERRGKSLRHAGRALTAGVLRREIALVLASHDLEQPEGNIVATGADAGIPHTQGADSKQLRAGESIVVDLYPKGLLFADCTRTFCVGEPGDALHAAHALCADALQTSQAAAGPGVLGADLQKEVCRLFEARGFVTARSNPGTRSGYVHGLGHGVGYELHEYPSFRSAPDNTGTLEVNDIFTLEPGLYAPEMGYGVRLENLLLLTEKGAENLTPLPYDLDPRAW